MSLIILCMFAAYFKLFNQQLLKHKGVLNIALGCALDSDKFEKDRAKEYIKNKMPYLTKIQVEQLHGYISHTISVVFSRIDKKLSKATKRAVNREAEIKKWIRKKYPWMTSKNINIIYYKGLYARHHKTYFYNDLHSYA